MNPRSKSVWMVPAAWGAVSPMWMVQARASFGPAVRKVCRPEGLEPDVDQLDQTGLVLAVAGQQLGGVLGIEGGHLGLDLGAHHHRLGRCHQCLQLGRRASSPSAPSSTLKT